MFIAPSSSGLQWESGSSQPGVSPALGSRVGMQSFAQVASVNAAHINGTSSQQYGAPTGPGVSIPMMGQPQQLQQQQPPVTALDMSDFPALGAAVGSQISQPQPVTAPVASSANQPVKQQSNLSQVNQASLFSRMDNSSPAPESDAALRSNGSQRSNLTPASQAVGGPRASDDKLSRKV